MSAQVKFQDALVFETTSCSACGVVYALTADFERNRRDDHKAFYCPNGHNQWFPGETEAERLRKLLTEANTSKTVLAERLGEARAEVEAANKAAARLRKRVKAGTCPCCKRTFKQLAQHMATQHKDWGKAE